MSDFTVLKYIFIYALFSTFPEGEKERGRECGASLLFAFGKHVAPDAG